MEERKNQEDLKVGKAGREPPTVVTKPRGESFSLKIFNSRQKAQLSNRLKGQKLHLLPQTGILKSVFYSHEVTDNWRQALTL